MKHLTRILAGLLAAILLLAGGCEVAVSVDATPSPEKKQDETVVILDDAGNGGFGMVADSYKACGNPVAATIDNISGDIDKLGSITLGASYESIFQSLIINQFELVFEPQFPVVFTARRYVDGKEIKEDVGDLNPTYLDGYVEVYRGEDKWRWHSRADIKTPTPPKAAAMVNEYRYIGLTDMPDENASTLPTLGKNNELRVKLPLNEPGIYRYTLYFRESIDHTKERLTNGDELYSITFDVTIPKTENDYDFLAAEGYYYKVTSEKYEAGSIGDTAYRFAMLIRNNVDEHMCLNTTKAGKLERRDGDDWVEINDRLYHEAKQQGHDSIWDTPAYMEDGLLVVRVTIYPQQIPGEYRYTPAFVTEYGKKYDGVTIYFDLD